jgi:hypothetical protein
VSQVLATRGELLEAGLHSSLGVQFGFDLGGVRVHTDPAAAATADALGARAYTVGPHIVFGPGRYQPGSTDGLALLRHELAHVVQQSAGDGPGSIQTAPLEEHAAAGARGEARPATPVPGAAGSVQRDPLPVQRFSPAKGIVIDRTDRSIAISGDMELWGPEASTERAATIQGSINSAWTKTFPDGFSVSCAVRVTYRPTGTAAGDVTQVKTSKRVGPSETNQSGSTIDLNADYPQGGPVYTWTVVHEFGHLIGLRDRYSESIVSSVKGQFGGRRETPADPGYEGNVMAAVGGTVQSKNVADLSQEDQPSPYWVNDDDQVRDWVNAHSAPDIGRLSTANKLRAIQTLMGGWISDDDVAAISRICAAVTDHAQAEAIRNGVNVLDMTSIGQRTIVRLAFARMP